MQLTPRPGRVRAALAAAACALLAPAGPARGAEVDGSTLVYSEPERVTAIESVVQSTRSWANGRSLTLRLAVDALTGASANGAVPSSGVQTFTRSSGRSTYSIAPGKIPLDPSFHDTRLAGSAVWTLPLGRLSTTDLGLHLSSESDYLSIGVSAGITRDLALRNTTFAAGVSLAHDTVHPHGGMPEAFAPMRPATGGRGDDDRPAAFELKDDDEGGEGGSGGSGNKIVADFLVGVTQVLDRATVARVNYSIGLASGYLTDPYKFLSVVAAPGDVLAGEPTGVLYERRPDSRTKQSVYAEVRRRIGKDVAEASYRRYWDDWSVRSGTLELRLDHPLGTRTSLRPHYRHYHQGEAEFYTPFLVSGRSLPTHASADYRLGRFTASTFGLEVAHTFPTDLRFRFGMEYYLQRGDSSPPEAFGALASLDLVPDVSAWMFRAGVTVPVKW